MKKASPQKGAKGPAAKKKSKATRKARPADKKPSQRETSPAAARAKGSAAEVQHCDHCEKALFPDDRALFVEEERGRIFCSEDCISGYFVNEIEQLEQEYFSFLSPSDLSSEEKIQLAHLRWITLQEPDEVWCERMPTREFRYTLISEFQPGEFPIWCVCICLFLRGEPSFLYLAFTTKNSAMVDHYRRGASVDPEEVRQARTAREAEEGKAEPETENAEKRPVAQTDRLADPWTEDETMYVQTAQERSATDIQPEAFDQYQACLEKTLEDPNEVWSNGATPKLLHFLKCFEEAAEKHWYVIVARETEEDDQIEIIDAFPTRDHALVDRYRKGKMEVGETNEQSVSRLVH
ncbi:MAG: PBECR2 nuclease fold domain-containing protein [Bdellovibrionota bacterium]